MRQSLFAIFVCGAFAMGLTACGKGDKTPSAADAASKAGASLLLAAEDLLTLRASSFASGPVITGSVQPERRADLRAEVAAVVKEVLKENGEAVRAGDLLVRLDDTAIRDSLTSADESVRAVSQAFEQAERQVQRLKTLQQQGMTSLQALEDAEVRRNNAQSDLVAARSRVVSARQQLQRTSVRAPFDGVVSERKASAGDTAQVGKELVKVIDPRSMRFEGLVSADRMSELQIGQTVNFRVNGYTPGEFVGKVRRIDAAANATTRQVEVIVGFDDPATAPRVSGLFAEGRVESGRAQALMLPEAALVRAGISTHVWRVNVQTNGQTNGQTPGQTLAKVAVKVGERDPRSGEYPVQDGVAAGDRILRRPGSTLVDGQRFELAAPAALPASRAGSAGLGSAAAATAAK